MPQILLECTDNIIENDFTDLILQIHSTLAEMLPTELQTCKSRIVRHRDYVIGDGAKNNAFVHLTINVMKGRTHELLATVGSTILEMLRVFFEKSLTQLNLQITTAVGELPDVYKKAVVMELSTKIKIYKRGEAILAEIAEPVTQEEFNNGKLEEIIKQLETAAKEVRAVGFAAPQIGYPKRVITIGMDFDNPRRPNVKQFPNMTFVNPEIVYTSPETAEDWEGCASIDGLIALVNRPVTIRYKAQNPKGIPIEGELNNFPARVFQHELDHLNGILMDTKAIKTRESASIGKTEIISIKP